MAFHPIHQSIQRFPEMVSAPKHPKLNHFGIETHGIIPYQYDELELSEMKNAQALGSATSKIPKICQYTTLSLHLTVTTRFGAKREVKFFLDAKASADTLLDLCVLRIKVNSKQQLYICYWSWNTNGVNWFHRASAHTFSECRMIQR